MKMRNVVSVGSFWAGFFLVWCMGFIGLIIAFATGKEATKRGAKRCLLIVFSFLVVGLLILAFLPDSSAFGYNYIA